MALQDAEIRAEYAYLVRGFLRLARQFEQDSLRDEASCECAQKEHLHVKSFLKSSFCLKRVPVLHGSTCSWTKGNERFASPRRNLFCSLSLIKVCEVRFRLGFDARLGKQAHRLHHRDRLWVDNRAADVLYLDAMSHFVLDALLEFFRQQ
jgi:hypothetical protein